jgi:tetratricopeptide (TPR) repeat protein
VGKKKNKRPKNKKASSRPNPASKSPMTKAQGIDLDAISQLLQSGQYAEGLRLLKATSQPQQRPFLDQWGRKLMKDGDYNTAASLFEIVCQLFPQDDKAFNALAVSNSMAGNQEQALAAMKRCSELAPGSWRHHFNLGKLYMIREEWEEAKTELNASLDGASGPQLSQIQEYFAICQQKIDFPVVDLDGTSNFSVPAAAPSEPAATPAPTAPPAQAEATQVKEFGLSSSKRSNYMQPLPVPSIGRTDNPLNIFLCKRRPASATTRWPALCASVVTG